MQSKFLKSRQYENHSQHNPLFDKLLVVTLSIISLYWIIYSQLANILHGYNDFLFGIVVSIIFLYHSCYKWLIDRCTTQVLFFPDTTYPCITFYNYLMKKRNQHCHNNYCKYRHLEEEWTSFMKLLEVLNEAQKTIDICMYLFTQEKLFELMIHLHRWKNVKIRIITDSSGDDEKKIFSKTQELQAAGIEVKTFKSPFGHLMHHKFVVIDNKKVIHGSLNWTRNAILQNHESIAITMDSNTVGQFRKQFKKMWLEFDDWSKN